MERQLLESAAADPTRLVEYQSDSVSSRQLLKREAGNVTLFAFEEGQELSEHAAPFDALVHVIEGTVEISIAGEPHVVKTGEMIPMPARRPHALKAVKRFKMILTMIRS